MPPTVVVRAIYPGANPKVVAETVAAPIEQQINGVENMLYMSSQSTADGAMTLTVTFALGTDLDNAQVQVQNRVAQALPRLPPEVQRVGVTTEGVAGLIMVVHLISPDERYDKLYLANYAHLHVKDELARIAGVGSAQVFGAGEYSMRVWLDPDRLAARQLTATDVVRAIREQNVQVAAGVLGAPAVAERYDLPALDQRRGGCTTEDSSATSSCAPAPDGQITRDPRRRPGRARREPVRAAQPARQPAGGGDRHLPAARVERARDLRQVRATMERLKKAFPDGMDYRIVYDPTIFVRESIREVVQTLFDAVLLVVVVVLVFLQTWRASIIPLVAVPVSLVGTFAVMLLLGFSLNTLSLFGLVLAIGIVVDDAIVVVENVERHIHWAGRRSRRRGKAMDEVTGPIIAIALVLCAVFVPTPSSAGSPASSTASSR